MEFVGPQQTPVLHDLQVVFFASEIVGRFYLSLSGCSFPARTARIMFCGI